MQGDLDRPPIVIRKSRTKSLLMVVVSTAFTAALFLTWRGDSYVIADWPMVLGLVLFGLSVPLFLWQVAKPEQLTASPSGLEWRGLRKTVTYAWDQVSYFSVFAIRGSKMIGFDVEASGKAPKFLARINTALTGASAALPGLWEIAPEHVAEILNAARAKWGYDGKPR